MRQPHSFSQCDYFFKVASTKNFFIVGVTYLFSPYCFTCKKYYTSCDIVTWSESFFIFHFISSAELLKEWRLEVCLKIDYCMEFPEACSNSPTSPGFPDFPASDNPSVLINNPANLWRFPPLLLYEEQNAFIAFKTDRQRENVNGAGYWSSICFHFNRIACPGEPHRPLIDHNPLDASTKILRLQD